MKIRTYIFKVTNDTGTGFIRVGATSERSARWIIMLYEGCPARAIKRARNVRPPKTK